MVFSIIAAVIAIVASAGVYYQQKKMEAQAAKQAQEAKAVQVSGHDSNRGLYTVYGQTLVGSTIVWKHVTDKEARITQSGFTTISAATGSELTTNKDHNNNRWLYRAVTLCNGPVTDITNVTIDDEGYRSPRFTNKTNKHFATTYSLGPTAGQNFSALRTAYSSDFYGWASDAVGKGVAYAIERLYLHKDKPAYQGEPQTRYRVKGRALYDPRKDSTSSAYDSNLGTSSHRADTATTWEYSDNPVLALLDYMRSGEYGRGLDLSVIDIDSIAASADKCDVLVDIPQRLANDTGSVVTYYDPETGEIFVVNVSGDYPYYRADQQTTGVNANKQRRFRINMAVDPSKEILDNIQEILNVFRGNLSYANGKYFVHMADVASPVLTLNDDDIIGGLKIANGDRSQRMNRATVKFINQAKQYKTDQVSWPSLDSNEDGGLYATYLAQDEDEKLHRTFTIKGCTDFYQAQDTAEYLVRDSRSNLSVSGTFGSRCFGLIPGDVVALDYDSSGFSGKYFRVIQTQVDLVSMNVGLQLKEYDSSVYTWNTNRGNEPLGLSWQEEVVNADPTNLTIGTIATNTRTRADGSTALTLTVPFSDVPEAAQYVEISWAINNTNDYSTQLVFDTENQTQTEVAIERDGETYAVRARYFATNSYGTLMPSAYAETTHAVADLSGTKLDGIEDGATQNTGALADLDTVDTDQIDNDAITVAKLDTSLESTNYSAGVSGWKLTKAGLFEAGDGTFRGALTATSLSLTADAKASLLDSLDLEETFYALNTINYGALANITFTPNNIHSTGANVGEVTVHAGSMKAGSTTYTLASDDTVYTPYEVAIKPPYAGGHFYIIWSATPVWASDNSRRFTTSDSTTLNGADYMFVAIYDEVNNQWKAVDNLNATTNFTPLNTDYVIAVGTKTTTTGGFESLKPLIVYADDPEADQTVNALNAGTTITDGGITLSSGGVIKGGQAGYNDADASGFFLGYDTNAYKFSIGNNDNSQRLTFDGTNLGVKGTITVGSTDLTETNTLNANTTPSDVGLNVDYALEGINYNALSNVTFVANSWDGTANSNDGETYITAGTLKAGSTTRTIAAGVLYSPYEGGTKPPYSGNHFFIISGASDAWASDSSARFQTNSSETLADNAVNNHTFIAIYDDGNDQWKAVDNASQTTDFTPLTTDYVIAVGTKTSSSGGYDSLVPLTVYADDPEADQTVNALEATTTITGGGITMSAGGVIKGGQTAFNTGTGFFLGYDSSAYKFSIGNASSNSLTFDGTDLAVTGSITAGSFTLSTGASLSDADNQISNTNNNAFFRYETTAENDDVSALSVSDFNTQFGRNPRNRDILIVVNTESDPAVSAAYVYDTSLNPSAFVAKNDFLTGDLIVDGTVKAANIDVNDLITSGSLLTGSATISNDIRIGSGESVFSADSNGIYLGNETFADAEFSVTPAGALSATGATISGAITATSLSLDSGVTIGSSNLDSTVVDGATAGATANQDATSTILGGNHTGTVNNVAAATVTSGAAAGATASQVNKGLALLLNQNSDGSSNVGEAALVGIDKDGVPENTDGFIIYNGDKITVERVQFTGGITVLTNVANKRGFICFDVNKTEPFTTSNYGNLDVVFVWKEGTQWYYDDNASGLTFTPSSITGTQNGTDGTTAPNLLAIGFLETSSADLILTGGLFEPIALESAPFAGDARNSGTVGGISITGSKLYAGTGAWGNSNTGFYLDSGGDFSLKNKLKFDASEATLTLDGQLNATRITVGSGDDTAAMQSTGDVRFWAGSENPSATTPFVVQRDGEVFARNLVLTDTDGNEYFNAAQGFTNLALTEVVSEIEGAKITTYSEALSSDSGQIEITFQQTSNVTFRGKLNANFLGTATSNNQTTAGNNARSEIPDNFTIMLRYHNTSGFTSSQGTLIASQQYTKVANGVTPTSTQYALSTNNTFFEPELQEYFATSTVIKTDAGAPNTSGFVILESTVTNFPTGTQYIKAFISTTDSGYDLRNKVTSSASRTIEIQDNTSGGGFTIDGGAAQSVGAADITSVAIATNNGISGAATASAGAASFTLGLGDITPTSVTTTADVTVGGNLTVNGSTTELNTTTLQVQDKNIVLNYADSDTSSTADGAGITIQDAVNANTDATLLWNTANDTFNFSHAIDVSGIISTSTASGIGIRTVYGGFAQFATDSQLDLVSSSAGTWGSSLNFVEGSGNSNTDVWSIARKTTDGSGDSSLNFTFGTNNQHDNTIRLSLSSSGNGAFTGAVGGSKLNIGGTETIDSSRRLLATGAADLADGTTPSISGGTAYFPTKMVSPKFVFFNDADGDDNYIVTNDNNNTYFVNGNEAGVWVEFYGDRILSHAGLVFDWWKGKGAELKQFTNTASTAGTTFLTLHNAVGSSDVTGDLSQQQTFIDFVFTDSNANEYPQVRIGAQVGPDSDANTTILEGQGAFVVYTNNATASTANTTTGLNESFRVSYNGDASVAGDLSVTDITASAISGTTLTTSSTITIDSATNGFLVIDNGGGYESGIIYKRDSSSKWETYIPTTNDDFRFYSYGPGNTQLTIRDGNNGNGGTLLSGLQVTDGTNWYGHYGALLLNTSQNYTSSSRGWMMTNAYGVNKFALLYSDSATTLPGLTTGGAAASGTSVALEIDNSGDVTIANELTVGSLGISGGALSLSSAESVTLTLEADTDNAVSEEHNPTLVMTQDNGLYYGHFGLNGGTNSKFTGAVANNPYVYSATGFQVATDAENTVKLSLTIAESGETTIHNGTLFLNETSTVSSQVVFVDQDGGQNFAIKLNGESLDFTETEDSDKVHMRLVDDVGVNSPLGFNTGAGDGTQRITAAGDLLNIGYLEADDYIQLSLGTPQRQSTDYLYIGGDGLAGADAAIYIGNEGDGTGYGWRFYYHGSGSGNANDLSIRSENVGSPVDVLRFNQDGAATFANDTVINGTLEIDGGVGVGSSGTLEVRQQGDTVADGIALTSSNGTSHRIWKDSAGNFNFGAPDDGDAFSQDLNGNITVAGTISSGAITSTGNLRIGAGTQTANGDANITIREGNAFAGFDFHSTRTAGNIGGLRWFSTSSTSLPEAQLNIEVDGTLKFYNGTNGVQNVFTISSTGALSSGAIDSSGSIEADSYIKTTTSSADGVIINNSSGTGVGIRFSDMTTDGTGQQGFFKFFHINGSSYGSGAAFVASSTETLAFVVDGQVLVDSFGIKPASGTGAGTVIMNSNAEFSNVKKLTFTSGNSNVEGIYLSNAQRIYGNGLRALEVNGTNLQFGEGLTGAINIQADAGLQMNGVTTIDASLNATFADIDVSGDIVMSGVDNFLVIENSSETNAGIVFNDLQAGAWPAASSQRFMMQFNSGGESGVGSMIMGHDDDSYVGFYFQKGGSLECKGNVTAYGSTSDIRLKDNIQVIPNALEKVMALRGVTFNYKKDGSRSTGLIAQELNEVLPEVVYETNDVDTGEKHYAVRYGNTVGLLVEAIKELKQENDELRELMNILMEKTNGNH